jgi:hypothetical protein
MRMIASGTQPLGVSRSWRDRICDREVSNIALSVDTTGTPASTSDVDETEPQALPLGDTAPPDEDGAQPD